MRVCFVSILMLIPIVSAARTTRETSYRYDQIWNTAVRFIRVDGGFKITEKDKDSGYLIFNYSDGNTTQIGSMELVETHRNQRARVSIGLRIQNMPSYVEILLLDKLERKLRDEYGDPPIPPIIRDGGEKTKKARSNERLDESAKTVDEKADEDASD